METAQKEFQSYGPFLNVKKIVWTTFCPKITKYSSTEGAQRNSSDDTRRGFTTVSVKSV